MGPKARADFSIYDMPRMKADSKGVRVDIPVE